MFQQYNCLRTHRVFPCDGSQNAAGLGVGEKSDPSFPHPKTRLPDTRFHFHSHNLHLHGRSAAICSTTGSCCPLLFLPFSFTPCLSSQILGKVVQDRKLRIPQMLLNLNSRLAYSRTWAHPNRLQAQASLAHRSPNQAPVAVCLIA